MKKFFLITLILSFSISAHSSHKVSFVEITVKDLSRARSFYKSNFNWGFSKRSPTFESITGLGVEAGMLEVSPEQHVPGQNIKLFIEVKNLDEKLKEIIKSGGKVILEPYDTGAAVIAEFLDTEGNLMGLIYHKPGESN